MKPQPLGPLLRATREQRGLSLNEVARQAGTAPANVKRIEEGGAKVAWESVCRICEVLGLRLDDVREKTRA